MNGREAARRVYRTFHGREANREVRVNVPETPDHAPALGVGTAIEYHVPEDWPSEKAGITYRHVFGDRGLVNTGAHPLIVDLGGGNLLLTPTPGEPHMTIEDRGIVG